jgi:uncharacterized membrane protein YhaH (DUF805 family)
VTGGCGDDKMRGGCDDRDTRGGALAFDTNTLVLSFIIVSFAGAILACIAANQLYVSADSVNSDARAMADNVVSIVGIVVGALLLAATFYALGYQKASSTSMSWIYVLLLLIAVVVVAAHGVGPVLDLDIAQEATNTTGTSLPIPYDKLPLTAYVSGGIAAGFATVGIAILLMRRR